MTKRVIEFSFINGTKEYIDIPEDGLENELEAMNSLARRLTNADQFFVIESVQTKIFNKDNLARVEIKVDPRIK